LKRLNTQLNKSINQNPLKSPNMISQQKNHYYKTLGSTVIKSPMSSPSPRKSCNLFILNITKQVMGSIFILLAKLLYNSLCLAVRLSVRHTMGKRYFLGSYSRKTAEIFRDWIKVKIPSNFIEICILVGVLDSYIF
jgi:hypothetical protein